MFPIRGGSVRVAAWPSGRGTPWGRQGGAIPMCVRGGAWMGPGRLVDRRLGAMFRSLSRKFGRSGPCGPDRQPGTCQGAQGWAVGPMFQWPTKSEHRNIGTSAATPRVIGRYNGVRHRTARLRAPIARVVQPAARGPLAPLAPPACQPRRAASGPPAAGPPSRARAIQLARSDRPRSGVPVESCGNGALDGEDACDDGEDACDDGNKVAELREAAEHVRPTHARAEASGRRTCSPAREAQPPRRAGAPGVKGRGY